MSRSLDSGGVTCVSAGQELTLAAGLPLAPLRELLRATWYAADAGRPVREFAIGARRLFALGLSECDLRWLWYKGLVQDAGEDTGTSCGRKGAGFQALAPQSTFVLTGHGIELFEYLLVHADSSVTAAQSAEGGRMPTVQTPNWNPQLRELRVDQVLVKRFCVPAENQERILSAFQEEAWPLRIDDPLPPVLATDPKRRLHSTIQCLNRNQRTHLVHFHGDGNGCGIRWELLSGQA